MTNMTLAFSTQHDGKPTHFPEKIMNGLYQRGKLTLAAFLDLYTNYKIATKNYSVDHEFNRITPKYHTIRVDAHDRWDENSVIHAVVGNRTTDRYQFVPTMPVQRIQEVFMTYAHNDILEISVDDRELVGFERNELAINDGFDNWEDFFDWFYPIIENSKNKCFKGKIIHWTDLKY